MPIKLIQEIIYLQETGHLCLQMSKNVYKKTDGIQLDQEHSQLSVAQNGGFILLEWFQFTEHCWDQFCDCRMDMHCSLNNGVW